MGIYRKQIQTVRPILHAPDELPIDQNGAPITNLIQKNKNPNEQEIRDWLEGNICRCTGYQNIVAAVKEAASKMWGNKKWQV